MSERLTPVKAADLQDSADLENDAIIGQEAFPVVEEETLSQEDASVLGEALRAMINTVEDRFALNDTFNLQSLKDALSTTVPGPYAYFKPLLDQPQLFAEIFDVKEDDTWETVLGKISNKQSEQDATEEKLPQPITAEKALQLGNVLRGVINSIYEYFELEDTFDLEELKRIIEEKVSQLSSIVGPLLDQPQLINKMYDLDTDDTFEMAFNKIAAAGISNFAYDQKDQMLAKMQAMLDEVFSE